MSSGVTLLFMAASEKMRPRQRARANRLRSRLDPPYRLHQASSFRGSRVIARDLVARPLILPGVPYIDIVGVAGTLILPHANSWAWWAAGMALHLLVGAKQLGAAIRSATNGLLLSTLPEEIRGVSVWGL